MGLFDSYRAARRNLLEIIPRRALHQPVISGRTGPQRWHMLMDPPAIRRVMLEAVEEYPKSVATRAVLQPAIGDSLFLAEGEHWRWQRRATAPAFSARSIDALTPVMTRAAEAAADRLDASSRAGRQHGRAHDRRHLRRDRRRDLLGRIRHGPRRGVPALERYIDDAARMSILDVLGVPASIPRPARAFAARQLRQMHAEADAAIARRSARGSGGCPTFSTACWGRGWRDRAQDGRRHAAREPADLHRRGARDDGADPVLGALSLRLRREVQAALREEAQCGRRSGPRIGTISTPPDHPRRDRGGAAPLPARGGPVADGARRPAERGGDPTRRHGDDPGLGAAPPPAALGRPMRSGPAGGWKAPARPMAIPSLRRRSAHLHRHAFRPAGGDDHPRDASVPLSLLARSGANAETGDDPDDPKAASG
jgi:hypothetical protein